MAADAARLEQVVNNLLDNALKYTPPGGRIMVSVERADDTAVLRVRDTGQGIRTELLGRVPIGLNVREGGDTGTPVVIGDPSSDQAKALQAVADAVARKVETGAVAARGLPTIKM